MIKRLLVVSLISIAVACGVRAQDVSVRYQSLAISSRGLPLANQNVAICTQPAVTTTQPCSPLAILGTSTSTTTGGANPTTTDSNGNFFFYAPAGKYTIQIYGPQVGAPFVQPDATVQCPTTGVCTFTAQETFTGGLNTSALQGLFLPDNNKYTSCQAAINAMPSSTPKGGTLLLGDQSVNPCKLNYFFGKVRDGTTELTTIGVGSFIHVWDLSRYFQQDVNNGNLNNGYTHGPRFYMGGSDSLGSGNSSEFEIAGPNHIAVTLNQVSGTFRLIDTTAGCVGNGSSTTCTILSGEPSINDGVHGPAWAATSVVCLMGFTAGSALNACQTLTAVTSTTFTFNSSFNGTSLGTSSTGANLATGDAKNRQGIVFRKDADPTSWTSWELGAGINGTNCGGSMAYSLQNYTSGQGGTTMWSVDPYTGTLTINANCNSVDNTKTVQIFPRVNVTPKLYLAGPASRVQLNDGGGNNGNFIDFMDNNVVDGQVLWLGPSASPANTLEVLSNIAGGHVALIGGNGTQVGELLDENNIVDLPKSIGMSTSSYTNATTTASNITGLSFAVRANVNYTMTCNIYYQSSASTAGLDITITGPASPTSVFYDYVEHNAATTLTNSVSSAFGTKLVGGTVTATTNLTATVTMGLRNGANAGTVQVQGSATGAGTVTVQNGSACTLLGTSAT